MSNEIQAESLQFIEEKITELKKQTVNNVLEIGNYLIEAKKQLSHGEWGNWLEEKVKFSQRTANQFMKVAAEFSNSQAISNLGTTKLFLLLDVPTDKRESFISENNLESMTTRQMQEKIKSFNNNQSDVDESKLFYVETNKLKPLPEHDQYFKKINGNAWIDFLRSVQTSGIIEPVLINQDKLIISGHERVRACRALDIKTVPCYIKKYTDSEKYFKEDIMLRDCLTSNLKFCSDDFDIAWNALKEHGWL